MLGLHSATKLGLALAGSLPQLHRGSEPAGPRHYGGRNSTRPLRVSNVTVTRDRRIPPWFQAFFFAVSITSFPRIFVKPIAFLLWFALLARLFAVLALWFCPSGPTKTGFSCGFWLQFRIFYPHFRAAGCERKGEGGVRGGGRAREGGGADSGGGGGCSCTGFCTIVGFPSCGDLGSARARAPFCCGCLRRHVGVPSKVLVLGVSPCFLGRRGL
jgi:hypothetical protein